MLLVFQSALDFIFHRVEGNFLIERTVRTYLTAAYIIENPSFIFRLPGITMAAFQEYSAYRKMQAIASGEIELPLSSASTFIYHAMLSKGAWLANKTDQAISFLIPNYWPEHHPEFPFSKNQTTETPAENPEDVNLIPRINIDFNKKRRSSRSNRLIGEATRFYLSEGLRGCVEFMTIAMCDAEVSCLVKRAWIFSILFTTILLPRIYDLSIYYTFFAFLYLRK